MRLLLNILWIVFGGGLTAIGWLIASLLMAISIIGIPWARACFNIAHYTFLPFGNQLVDRRELQGHGDIGTGPLGLIGNVIWFILGGWYLMLSHFVVGVLLCLTIIGIPFGVAHFKLMRAAIFPIGKAVVPGDVMHEIRKRPY